MGVALKQIPPKPFAIQIQITQRQKKGDRLKHSLGIDGRAQAQLEN
jgi:hypothetical protein